MPKIEISEETLEKIKDQLGEDYKPVELDALDDLIGQKWFFRTVTYHMVGKVKKRLGNFLVMEDATWVADSKRFNDCIKNGFSSEAELEPVGEALINLDSVVDAFPFKHKLPTKQQ